MTGHKDPKWNVLGAEITNTVRNRPTEEISIINVDLAFDNNNVLHIVYTHRSSCVNGGFMFTVMKFD